MKTHDNIVYVFGPEIQGLLPTDRIDVKIGKSKNNPIHFDRRWKEHKRHVPRDTVMGQFVTDLPTNNPDDFIRLNLCREFPAKFTSISGAGRDVIQGMLVSDVPLLLAYIKRNTAPIPAVKVVPAIITPVANPWGIVVPVKRLTYIGYDWLGANDAITELEEARRWPSEREAKAYLVPYLASYRASHPILSLRKIVPFVVQMSRSSIFDIDIIY
jgi:hypothetical protein